MLLTITTIHNPATDLGYLLHKNPANAQTFDLKFGKAHVFYPEATAERCSAALLLEIDPVGLVRGQSQSFSLAQYVNDRPYVASSLLSVTISNVYGSALSGRSKERPELAETPIPLRAEVAVVPCRAGEGLLRDLFEPLGYAVTATQHPLDETFPDWGMSPYFTLGLEATCRLSDLLGHLYVMLPVLDNDKHYYVGDEEVDKLLRHGEGWLADHPARELVVRRYLKNKYHLRQAAMDRLIEEESPDADEEAEEKAQEEETVEKPLRLHQQRLDFVFAALKASGSQRVLDLGCGEGRLLRMLLDDPQFTEIVGMDVSYRTLEYAAQRLRLDRMADRKASRLKLIQGSLLYKDYRLNGYEAAAVVEVIEHLDEPRLRAFERSVFEFARPSTVIVTTPNVEYNVKFETMPAGAMRHRDHRFEWSRAEFQEWASAIATRFGYTARFEPIGPNDPEVGPPTQCAIFTLDISDESEALS